MDGDKIYSKRESHGTEVSSLHLCFAFCSYSMFVSKPMLNDTLLCSLRPTIQLPAISAAVHAQYPSRSNTTVAASPLR